MILPISGAEQINNSLTVVNDKTETLQRLQDVLVTRLTDVKGNLQTALSSITPCNEACNSWKLAVDALDTEADFDSVRVFILSAAFKYYFNQILLL